MRHDVDAVWNPMQKELFENVNATDKKAEMLLKKSPQKAVDFLTDYTNKWGNKVVKDAWVLGDKLWTKYDEKF